MRLGSWFVVCICASMGVWGCGASAAFVCVSDDDCNRGGDGACESSGFCSFPDTECETGRRYGGAAGDGLSQRCVPPEDETSGATTNDPTRNPTSNPTADATTGPTTTGPTPSTSEATAGPTSTTDRVTASGSSTASSETTSTDEDGSTGNSTTTAATTTTEAGSTSTGPAACDLDLLAEFDGPMLDAGWISSGAPVVVANGELVVQISVAVDDYAEISATTSFVGEGFSLEMSLGTPPHHPFSQVVMFVVRDDYSESYDLLLDGDTLVARHWIGGNFEDFSPVLFDPIAHNTVRLRERDGTVEYQHSADGLSFTTYHSIPADLSTWTASAGVGAGNWAEIEDEDIVSLERLRLCAAL